MKKGFALANPALGFTLAWLGVLWLLNLRLVPFYEPLHAPTLLLVGGNILTIWLLYIPLSMRFPRGDPGAVDEHTLQALLRIAKGATLVWLVGTVIEVIRARGVPLLWLLTGDSRSYVDFPIPTFHGFFTAAYLFAITSYFLCYRAGAGRRYLWITVLLLFWPIAHVNRGLMMWTMLQLAAVYLVLGPISLTDIARVVATGIIVVLAFGFLGDMRSGDKGGLANNVFGSNVPEWATYAPSGVIWVYLYLTTPLNNVNAVVDEIAPTHTVYYSTVNIIPTVLRSRLYDQGEKKYPLPLVNEGFNTATVYAGYLGDFGLVGGWIAVICFQALAVFLYLSARRRIVWAILAYVALYQGIVLSVFADLMTSLVCLAQIALALYVRARTELISKGVEMS